jgi:hypothetical protein
MLKCGYIFFEISQKLVVNCVFIISICGLNIAFSLGIKVGLFNKCVCDVEL